LPPHPIAHSPAGGPAGPPSRRRVLGAAARLVSGLAAGATAACAGRPVPAARPPSDLPAARAFRLPAVKVSRDRIIRTVAGLRPYRSSGFRVEREDLGGGRLLVHNYGHGGAGVTLSWGSAWLAVEELIGDAPPPGRAAVIGCGAVGLATARLLQRRGVDVTIYAKDLPPNTTSNVACAQWGPYSVSDARVHTEAFQDRLERAARISHRVFQEMVGVRYGVHWLPNYPLSDVAFGGPGQPDRLGDLFPESRDLEPGTHPFPVRYAREYTTMMIEPPVYLGAVMRDFQLAGGRVRIRDFGSLDEVAGLPERRLVNCTGIGARELVGDEELVPLKGQLTVLLPQPEIRYIALYQGLYMMPRADGILLGGTREPGEWSLEPNREAEERILAGHADFFRRMAGPADP
jgi:glycine/D-amino acid oxidase-like deaminating enzyme